MNAQSLAEIATRLLSKDRGLLAMDESVPTANKRFAEVGIPQTPEYRRAYRELIVTTPGLGQYIGGAILFDETIRQARSDGVSFVKLLQEAGVIPGIKVDAGAKPMPGPTSKIETITEGLDGLRERLREYFALGARFAKWRAVITIGPGIPSRACLETNASALARYAVLCQEAGIVPVVEPEVLMDGDHTLAECQAATEAGFHAVFDQLSVQGVALSGMILKPNMVLPGLKCPAQASAEEVADATVETLRRIVPPEVAGVAFLSGGQSGELASARLNAINAKYASPSALAPWPVSFSYARAVQQAALEIWKGEDANVAAAQRALLHRLACNHAARRGAYTSSMEREAA